MSRHLAFPLALALLPTFPLAACTGSEADGPQEQWAEPTWPELRSELAHDANPVLDADEEEAMGIDSRLFALELYHQLRQKEQGNLLFSPYSIRLALGMLYGGAKGETHDQMKATLHYSLDDERQHVGFNWLEDSLASRSQPELLGADGSVETGEVLVQPANGVWVEQGAADSVLPSYLDLLAQHYDIGVRLADFAGDKFGEVEKINQWVEARTHGLIPELIEPGDVPDTLTMALVNALYLKAPWAQPFDGPTSPASFTGVDGESLTVTMMSHSGLALGHGSGADYQIVSVPLRGSALEFIALMPTGDFAEFEASLDEVVLSEALDSLQSGYAPLYLPKLDFGAKFRLVKALSALGMPVAFNGADFSGIGVGDSIANVIHETVLIADEDGVEAAAATAVLLDDDVGGGGEGVDPIVIDRAFFLMIRDAPSDNLLFFGRVANPQSEGE